MSCMCPYTYSWPNCWWLISWWGRSLRTPILYILYTSHHLSFDRERGKLIFIINASAYSIPQDVSSSSLPQGMNTLNIWCRSGEPSTTTYDTLVWPYAASCVVAANTCPSCFKRVSCIIMALNHLARCHHWLFFDEILVKNSQATLCLE
jgi:hypothetical protein